MSKFPDVYYVDGSGRNGVNQTQPSSEAVLIFSDGQYTSTLPQQYLDADYLINVPCLKTHNEGGITLIAKNHQGSFLEKGDDPKSQYAINMHYSLPKNSSGARQYRHTVDYMGHEQTGGKGLIYIVDGIWAGLSWEGWIRKYKSDPFKNDYPSSIFVGQDPVALESVCYDVIFNEYVTDPAKARYPIEMKVEIADHLKQCASSDYWPSGIQYDPEGDGSPIESLGVFEHWNNPSDRQYSRNLGTGEGIELIYVDGSSVGIGNNSIRNCNIATPNPFSSSTTFRRPENISENSTIEIYNMKGELVQESDFTSSPVFVWDGSDAARNPVPDGIYLYKIRDRQNQALSSGKVILNRD
jgi:hypothetical protein